MNCDACGKEMTDEKGCSLGGISFKTKLKKDAPPDIGHISDRVGLGDGEIKVSNMTCLTALLDVQVDHPDIEFLKSQMGAYVLDKEYNICFECWLKSMGVKP